MKNDKPTKLWIGKPVVAAQFLMDEEYQIDVKPKQGEMSEEELSAIIQKEKERNSHVLDYKDDYFPGY